MGSERCDGGDDVDRGLNAAEFHAAGHDVLVVACPGDGLAPAALARLTALAGTAADGTAITVLDCHPIGDIATGRAASVLFTKYPPLKLSASTMNMWYTRGIPYRAAKRSMRML